MRDLTGHLDTLARNDNWLEFDGIIKALSLRQCETCDSFFPPGLAEGDEHHCCDECVFEAEEDRRIARIEAKREYQIYGTDLDSWFR